MNRYLAALAFVFYSFLQPGTAKSDDVALVIGNQEYLRGALANPRNDAEKIAEALARVGFRVVLRTDTSQRDLQQAVREFAGMIEPGDTALFYFAGHGVQVDGRNYLLPVDAEISKEFEVEHESVDVNRVLGAMREGRTRLNVVILDCCRDNPFERSFRSTTGSAGLATLTAPESTVIAFATAPGKTAADGEGVHSPYTQALLAHLETPGLRITDMLQRVSRSVYSDTGGIQRPWKSDDLLEDFFLVPGESSPPPVATTPMTKALPAKERDTPSSPSPLAEIDLVFSGGLDDSRNYEHSLRINGELQFQNQPVAIEIGMSYDADYRVVGRDGRFTTVEVAPKDVHMYFEAVMGDIKERENYYPKVEKMPPGILGMFGPMEQSACEILGAKPYRFTITPQNQIAGQFGGMDDLIQTVAEGHGATPEAVKQKFVDSGWIAFYSPILAFYGLNAPDKVVSPGETWRSGNLMLELLELDSTSALIETKADPDPNGTFTVGTYRLESQSRWLKEMSLTMPKYVSGNLQGGSARIEVRQKASQ